MYVWDFVRLGSQADHSEVQKGLCAKKHRGLYITEKTHGDVSPFYFYETASGCGSGDVSCCAGAGSDACSVCGFSSEGDSSAG